MLRLSLFFLLVPCYVQPTQAAINTIALSNTTAIGTGGATLADFQHLSLNAAGKVAFSATLVPDGSVTTQNDQILYLYEGSLDALAREGIGGVPNVAGGAFGEFLDIALADTGQLVIRANLQDVGSVTSTNDKGFWKLSPTGGQLLVRTGDDATGIAGATFSSLFIQLRTSHGGQLAYRASVTGAGISTNNNGTLWANVGSTNVVLSREGTTAVPGIPEASFLSFGQPEINNGGEVVFRGTLNAGSGITSSNRNGVWKLSSLGDQLLARSGSGGVPGVSGEHFAGFRDPVINSQGQVVFNAYLPTGQEGFWKYDAAGNGELLALGDSGNVTGIPGADFWFFGDAKLSSTGQVIYAAILRNSDPAVASANNQGLWTTGPLGNQLVARSGSGAVPGVAGADFSSFSNYDVNASGDIATLATLAEGPGGISTANNQGIWLFPEQASPQLVVREGDTLAGHTIADLSLLNNDETNIPARFFNDAGQIAFHATFTDGSSGLFLFSPNESISADFNDDTLVDATDLAIWQDAYGGTAGGDADGDGDTDGRDFLAWQRQFTPAGTATAVPEPVAGVLLASALCCCCARGGSHRRSVCARP